MYVWEIGTKINKCTALNKQTTTVRFTKPNGKFFPVQEVAMSLFLPEREAGFS